MKLLKGVGNFGGFVQREKTPHDALLERVKTAVADPATAPEDLLESTVAGLNALPDYSWAGIYMVEGTDLVLRAWKGPQPTEHTRIPVGEGVCGAVAASGKPEVVGDVSRDPRYLECFPSTKSEIVVPILDGNRVIGEIDVDSDVLEAFGEKDRIFLEKLAFRIATRLKSA